MIAPNFRLIAAHAYADLGWRVLPLVPDSKAPIGRLVPHAYLDATTNPAVIDGWWSRNPERNIGIACAPSGLVVVDVDPRHGGDDQFHDFERELDPLPSTPRARTRGGGEHLYLRHPGVALLARLSSGVEIKAPGYVVAPPSVITRRYTWQDDADPEDVPLADVPPAWLDRMTDWPRMQRGPALAASTDGQPMQRQDRIPPADYLRDLAGVEVDGRGYASCPWHEDRTPSLKAYDTAERGWFCYSCRRGGSIYDLAGRVLGIESHELRGARFEAVWRHVRTFYGLAVEEPA